MGRGVKKKCVVGEHFKMLMGMLGCNGCGAGTMERTVVRVSMCKRGMHVIKRDVLRGHVVGGVEVVHRGAVRGAESGGVVTRGGGSVDGGSIDSVLHTSSVP